MSKRNNFLSRWLNHFRRKAYYKKVYAIHKGRVKQRWVRTRSIILLPEWDLERKIEALEEANRVDRIYEIYHSHNAVYAQDCGEDQEELQQLCAESRAYEEKYPIY